MNKRVVGIVVVAVTVVLSIWDIFLAADGADGNTISEVIREVSGSYPVVPFGFGFLMGHWFWVPSKEEDS